MSAEAQKKPQKKPQEKMQEKLQEKPQEKLGTKEALDTLEMHLGYRFQDRKCLQVALTHKSLDKQRNYERLEFLGDRLLGSLVAETLYKRFPNDNEGELSKRMAAAVSQKRISRIAQGWQVSNAVLMSDEVRKSGFAERPALLADVCESLLAAVYLEGGMEALHPVVQKHWAKAFEDHSAKKGDARSLLQEWCQARALPLPAYACRADGPDHQRSFSAKVSVETQQNHSYCAEAVASSKKLAIQSAAEKLFVIVNDASTKTTTDSNPEPRTNS